MLQLVFSREDVGGFKLSFFSFLMAITHHTKWEQLKSFLFKSIATYSSGSADVVITFHNEKTS